MSIEKQIDETRKDLVEIFDEEYEKRRIITADFTAIKMQAKGYRKQEWISVEDRLPSDEEQRDEYGELVPFLVCERDTTYPYRAFYDGKEWGDGLMRIRGITHWMHLPEPPKGE